MGAIKKAGVEFYAKIDTNRDLIGQASQFSAEVIVDATGSLLTDASANASIGVFVEVGSTGIYRAPITLTDEGDYTISVKWTDGTETEYIPFPVEVKAADMSDIKALIDALQGDMTLVKDQVDTLDETELNNIAEQLLAVQNTVNNVNNLIDDTSSATFAIDSDETATLNIGDTVTGGTSGATGIITAISAGSVSVKEISGTFADGEAITEAASTGIISTIVLGTSTMNSVMEYVQAINTALSGGGSSLSVLEAFVDNVELMLEGKAFTDTAGNAVLEADSYGLAEIFAAITSNGTDIGTANTAITALAAALGTQTTTITTAITASELVITTAITASQTALETKIDAIKTVVDANATTLGDAGFGLAALKTLIDDLDTSVSLLATDTSVRFDTVDAAIAALDLSITGAITAQTATLEARFDALDIAVSAGAAQQQYKGFV